MVTGPFADGDRVLLLDAKRRRYLVTLQEGGEFHSHNGVVRHDELLGPPEGSVVLGQPRRAVHGAAARRSRTSCS